MAKVATSKSSKKSATTSKTKAKKVKPSLQKKGKTKPSSKKTKTSPIKNIRSFLCAY